MGAIHQQMSLQQHMWFAAQMYEDGIAIIRSAISDRYPIGWFGKHYIGIGKFHNSRVR